MKATFLYMLRRLRLSIVGWGLGLAIISALTVLIYDSIKDKMDLINTFMKDMPPIFVAMAGEASQFGTASGWLHAKLFSVLPVLFGFFMVTASAGLLAVDEERGRLDLFMAYPVSRARVFFGRLAALLCATVIIMLCCWLGIVLSIPFSPMKLAPLPAFLPFVSTMAPVLLFQGFALLLAMILPSRRLAAGATAVLLIGSFFVEILYKVDNDLIWLASLFPLHYYQGGLAIDGFNWGWFLGVSSVGVLFIMLAWWRFEKRDIRVIGEGTLSLPRFCARE